MSCLEYSANVSVHTSLLNPGECFLLKPYGSGYSEVIFSGGSFRIEVWGGSSGRTTAYQTNLGGLGGYSSGVISVQAQRVFYFYIGTSGTDSIGPVPGHGGFNGGSDGAIDDVDDNCASGGSGGSTDMRIINNNFGQENSLLSRIMVAGGGGSAGCFIEGGRGGNAGGVLGSSGNNNGGGTGIGGGGGKQNSGFSLCYGGKGISGNEAGGSGGGGYWGGYGGQAGSHTSGAGGGGGSSYVSGHSDCIALHNVTKLPLGTSIHPSSIQFTNTQIIPGNSQMPSISIPGSIENNGHEGSGAVRITLLKFNRAEVPTCYETFTRHILFILSVSSLAVT